MPPPNPLWYIPSPFSHTLQGYIEPGEEQVLKVYYLPGVPGVFCRTFQIQVGHLEPEKISLKGEGIFPRIYLDLPRNIKGEHCLIAPQGRSFGFSPMAYVHRAAHAHLHQAERFWGCQTNTRPRWWLPESPEGRVGLASGTILQSLPTYLSESWEDDG